ncbi:MAG: immunoglobulin domain-containing protein [Acidobacteriota bacterium]|nr:immunoglobulin domain-containing protein [Acidobacteriota bacterium]
MRLPFLICFFPITLWGQVQVTLPDLVFQAGEPVTFDISVSDLMGRGVESYAFQLDYDAAVVDLTGVSLQGTLSQNLNLAVNTQTPGRLIVSAASLTPLAGAGVLCRVEGNTIMTGQTMLTLSSFSFNEGNPTAQVQNGSLEIPDLQPVTFTVQPVAASVCRGSGFSLAVTADGTEPITYQWRRNGEAVPGANAATYVVTAAESQDSGVYDCLATNPAGTETSASTQVLVSTGPVLSDKPDTPVACEGQALTLSVAATGVNLSYQWQKDGVDIPGANSMDLTFEALASEDRGIYRCRVEDDCGSLTTWDIPLFVDQQLTIDAHPQDMFLGLEDTMVLSVTTQGSQPIQYQWMFQGYPIPHATSPSLTIDPMRSDDFGYYYCRISNPCGSIDTRVAAISQKPFPDYFEGDQSGVSLGNAVAMDGSWVVVGNMLDDETQTDSGAVLIYHQVNGNWLQNARLKTPSPVQNGHFGFRVDVKGDRVMVGAPGENRAYIYRYTDGNWTMEADLYVGTGYGFGNDVALEENWAVVGAPLYSSRGAIYLYRYYSNRWNYYTRYNPSTAYAQKFGWSVDADGTTLLVGAPNDRVNNSVVGSVSVYTYSNSLSFRTLMQPSYLNSSSEYGYDVAIKDDVAVVGARSYSIPRTRSGAVFVFRGAAGTWAEEERLLTTTTTNYTYFGTSVALYGNRILAGDANNSSPYSGARLFLHDGATWLYKAEFREGDQNNNGFGQAVALSDGFAAIGAPNENSRGHVYFYQFEPPPDTPCPKPLVTAHPKPLNLTVGATHALEFTVQGSGSMTYQWYRNSRPLRGENQPALTIADAGPEDQGVYYCVATDDCDSVTSSSASVTIGQMPALFDFSTIELEAGDNMGPVAVSANWAAVGVPGYDNNSGLVYLYRWDGDAWHLDTRLLRPPVSSAFGADLALSGERLVVRSGGYLHVYHRQSGIWVLRDSLNTGSPSGALVLQGDELIAGYPASHELATGNGRILIYRWNGLNWVLADRLPRQATYIGDNIGNDLALSGDHLVAGVHKRSINGSNSGVAMMFRRREDLWQLEAVHANPTYLGGTYFGNAVAVSSNTLAISATHDDSAQTNAGSVFIYENVSDRWHYRQTVSPAAPNNYAGYTVALSGDKLLINAPNNDDLGTNTGQVYLYEKDDEVWTDAGTLFDPNGDTNDNFGTYIALDGYLALAGSSFADYFGLESGVALGFGLEAGNINDCLMGDVTANGAVSAFDAAQILAAVVGAPTDYDPIPSCAADVTCNGTVSAFDAAQILRHVAGIDPVLECLERRSSGSGRMIAGDMETAAAPFKVSLDWVGQGTLGLRMQITYDPQRLALHDISARLPAGWSMVDNRHAGRVILAAAGPEPLTETEQILSLFFLPLETGPTTLSFSRMTIDEHERPELDQAIDLQITPCPIGSWPSALASWSRGSDVRQLVGLLSCSQQAGGGP